jgi:SAM-dependent methyltransferase
LSIGQRLRNPLRRAVLSLPHPLRRRLLAAKLHLEERSLARRIGRAEIDSGPHDGLAVPPPLLRVRVSGPGAERETWLESGAVDADLIRRLMSRNGIELTTMDAMLDFGCGCGRVARHWAGLQGPAIHGADASGELVRWCQDHLPFMDAVEVEALPPSPYPAARFDFVYALSVLTHLPEDAGFAWVRELVRSLKPGGLLLFTVHGERLLGVLDEPERARFHAGRLVTRLTELAGTNSCTAYHPVEYVVADLLPAVDVELVDAVHEDLTGGRGVLSPMPLQDNYLVRKRA